MGDGESRVVVGRYRLVAPLGRGGMGAVWRAHDSLLGRDVAIKEIWLPSAGNGQVDPADPMIRRALREAQAAARLRHPGIVTVHDVVTDEGRPWIVMELVNGQTLAEAIAEHGLLSERRTAEIGLHVLDALRAAHREGIAHRDVKPANILLDTDRVVLTDFGIAAVDDATALTATGQMVGSPAYLSPERINGQPATAAGDLWALGVTLYTAVTGKSPFQREDTQTTFAAILNSKPVTPAHAGRLWPVIKGLLEKDPERRLTTEPARKLLANVAGTAEPGTPDTERRRRWWPAQQRRSGSDREDMAGTLAAPSPTIAAPTAVQEPPGKRAPAPRQRPATEPVTVAAETVAAETVAGETDAADTVAAETAAADTVAGETVAGDTVAVDTVAAPVTVPRAPLPVSTPLPPRTGRKKPVWLAALAVGGVLLAGGIARAAWPGADGEGGAGGTRPSSVGSQALAAAPSVKPSASATTWANPSLDPCLVGRWKMTSMQVVNHFEGKDTRFTGKVGASLRIWPDGKEVDDYNKSGPLTATINGAKYVETLRGTETLHVETRGGKVYGSEYSGNRTIKITRNGRTVWKNSNVITPSDNLPYICTDTRLTTYGNDKVSTQSFQRISRTP